jgi:hypothetical protein
MGTVCFHARPGSHSHLRPLQGRHHDQVEGQHQEGRGVGKADREEASLQVDECVGQAGPPKMTSPLHAGGTGEQPVTASNAVRA